MKRAIEDRNGKCKKYTDEHLHKRIKRIITELSEIYDTEVFIEGSNLYIVTDNGDFESLGDEPLTFEFQSEINNLMTLLNSF